jgi:DNA anti-recombination protein RmuC
MATLNLTLDDNQLSVLADYYKAEQKKLKEQLESINAILAKIESKPALKKRGRKPKKVESVATDSTPKKRGPKPGSKRGRKPKAVKAVSATGAKRGRKPKNSSPSAPASAE